MTTLLAGVVAETQLGWCGVALSGAGIRYATLPHLTEAAARGELQAFGAGRSEDGRSAEVQRLLTSYGEGAADALEGFPVDLPECSALQREVWMALREIPAGETRSYGWMARRVGRPSAARAVGAAVGANPVPLWLPCHRVVASDGSLHGFGGGLAMKRELLELEGALPRPLPI